MKNDQPRETPVDSFRIEKKKGWNPITDGKGFPGADSGEEGGELRGEDPPQESVASSRMSLDEGGGDHVTREKKKKKKKKTEGALKKTSG